ncbi:MAG: tetratricopeptide repeat protein [Candidatus Staskawiczbacteria bacterium]|jgi:tetratricopeptide (TPR) repeat protein
MAKELSLALRICDWFAKYSIYAAIFLMPIFFLPWTADVLDFNKQALLILLVFVALFAWMLKVLILGKFEVNASKMHVVVGIMFLIYLLATIFSVNQYGSFWGWPQSSSESLLTLIGLAVFYFLVSNTFSKKNIFTGAAILSISALIAEFVGFFQLSGLFLPFDFAKSVSFNTIGSVGSLGFFAAILLPLTIVMLIIAKNWWRLLFAVELILSALILFLINYSIIWWAVIIGSVVVMVFAIVKRNTFDGRWMALPMFFLAVSLFFILLNPQIPWIAQKANEVFLSQGASSGISLQAIKERPIFGSGPGTFSYDFSKFKDPSFSGSSLWNVIFSQATSKVLNDLASAGLFGFIALLALMAFPIFYGVKFLVSEKTLNSEVPQAQLPKIYWILTLGVLTALAAQAITYFLYNSNVVLSFLNFFMIACLVGLITSEKKGYELRPSSVLTLAITFIFTLVFIFGLGLLILDGQRYVAEVNYYFGLALWQSGNKDAGQKRLESAASINPSSDLYFRQLSQVYLSLLQDELQNVKGTPSDTEKTKVQTLISNSVNAAKIAANLNPESSSDWANLGYVYQSLNGFIGDSSTWALSSYDQALKLDPNDPYLLSQEGTVDYISAEALGSDKADQKSQLLSQAQAKLEKSVALNPNYSNGLYTLGLVYDALGKKDKAIAEFTKVQQLNPKDTTIPKILSNLNAGLPALQSPPATTPPATNSSGSSTITNPPATALTPAPPKPATKKK